MLHFKRLILFVAALLNLSSRWIWKLGIALSWLEPLEYVLAQIWLQMLGAVITYFIYLRLKCKVITGALWPCLGWIRWPVRSQIASDHGFEGALLFKKFLFFQFTDLLQVLDSFYFQSLHFLRLCFDWFSWKSSCQLIWFLIYNGMKRAFLHLI